MKKHSKKVEAIKKSESKSARIVRKKLLHLARKFRDRQALYPIREPAYINAAVDEARLAIEKENILHIVYGDIAHSIESMFE